MNDISLSAQLAERLIDLQYDKLPDRVVGDTKTLFIDWFASALAGRNARPVQALKAFATTMGPDRGPSQLLPCRNGSSPYFAALVNAASSHVVEQDDLHNGSVFHPGTVVFPTVLAAGQALGVSGRALIAAAVAGYETGVRSGEYLGRSHYKVFHTTGTAGTLAAAAGVAHLLNLSAPQFSHALGSAGTQAAGLWEFLRDAADSKQLHTAKAAANGILAAYTARDGLTAAQRILEGEQGLAAGLMGEANVESMLNGWGERWAVSETSFKFHASCRHTHPAADAMLAIVTDYDLSTDDIVQVRAYVYGAAIDVLGAVVEPRNIHQSKFSMGFVLALIAARRSAAVTDFTEHALHDPLLRRLHGCTEMIYDPDIDAAYPQQWSARVEVDTADGRSLQHTVATPKGDPDNALTREEVETKTRSLAAFADGATRAEIDSIIAAVWQLENIDDINDALRLPPPNASPASRRAIPA